MPFSQLELANIANSTLEYFFDRPNVARQNVEDKPMMKAFEDNAGTFAGGTAISLRVKSGQGGGALAGYTNDDQVSYYNPTSQRKVIFNWREHHIGIGLTHTELKEDGVTVVERGGSMDTVDKDGAEEVRLAGLLKNKMEDLDEDYDLSWAKLLLGDGTADAKAIAGIQAILPANPLTGTTGGFSRASNSWWRHRAFTAAAAAAGGNAAITSSTASGGALLQILQKERRQLRRYAQGTVKHMCFAGSDFLDAMERELRANGQYTRQGFSGDKSAVDGSMNTMDGIPFGSWNIVYDPIMDDAGFNKRLYTIDMRRVQLLYMSGEKKKKTEPARPYDRYTIYFGLTNTAALIAQQLNTSGVYDIN